MARPKQPPPVRHPLSELTPAVLPPLATRMPVDILVNPNSDVWLIYEGTFDEIVKWAEYDLDLNKLYLIMVSGRQQELGMAIPDPMRENLQYSDKILLMQMKDKDMIDCGFVPLMVRGHSIH